MDQKPPTLSCIVYVICLFLDFKLSMTCVIHVLFANKVSY